MGGKKQVAKQGEMTPHQAQQAQMPYVHTREQSDHHRRNLSAMRMVRTDSSAMTLDRFLVQGNLSNNSRTNQQMSTVVTMNIMSAMKLIHDFESDYDSDL